MSNQRNHELLETREKDLTLVAVTVNVGMAGLRADVGYLYVDNLDRDRVFVDSGTGFRYEVLIPEDLKNIEGGQFNIVLQMVELP